LDASSLNKKQHHEPQIVVVAIARKPNKVPWSNFSTSKGLKLRPSSVDLGAFHPMNTEWSANCSSIAEGEKVWRGNWSLNS
jgi:hypothetical protein